MSQPKFEVGEVVVLQSIKHPEANGEYEVLEIIEPNGTANINGETQTNLSGKYGYRLPPMNSDDTGWWLETSLRKRHQPGDYSFDGLKTILSMPVDRRDFA